jgi:hypothetical protein
MVIFHGYVSHNQMVSIPLKFHPRDRPFRGLKGADVAVEGDHISCHLKRTPRGFRGTSGWEYGHRGIILGLHTHTYIYICMYVCIGK